MDLGRKIKERGATPEDVHQMYNEAIDAIEGDTHASGFSFCGFDDLWLETIDRVKKLKEEKIEYLARYSSADKSDILDFWKGQSFDLEIDEHLGN